MALTDTKLRALRGHDRPYQVSDGGGLFIEVLPSGKRVWRLRYRLKARQEKVTLGEYPSFSLAEAREWQTDCKKQIAKGQSPMRAKQDEKERSKLAHADSNTVRGFAEQRWLPEVVTVKVKDPRNICRALEKDVYPAIGQKPLPEVTGGDIEAIVAKIQARGADHMALQTRNILKRLFAYAISKKSVTQVEKNPAAEIEAQHIVTAKPRDVALTQDEIGQLLRAIYSSSMRRVYKLGLHLLIICMVRKSELIEARWDELNLEAGEWIIPKDRMKQDRPHAVYLPEQAIAMFEELRRLSSGSEYVMPSRSSLHKPISRSTLNKVIKGLDLDIQNFVIHDFRRTASTHLHEAGFNSDVIEKALAHEQGGVRGVYNKAQYADQRRKLLQWWADFVDAQIEEGRKVILGRFGLRA